MRKHIAAVAWILVPMVALGGLYAALRETSDGAAPETRTFALTVDTPAVADTRSLDEFPVLKAHQGDTVVLLAHAAHPGSVHVHIYEKEVPLVPDGDATLSFLADVAGRFPIHLHDTDGTMHHLATLEVQPR